MPLRNLEWIWDKAKECFVQHVGRKSLALGVIRTAPYRRQFRNPEEQSLVIAYELPTRTLGHSSDKWHSGIDSVVSCFSHVLVDGGNFCLVRGVAHDNRNVLSRCLILNDVLAGPNSPSACARAFASSRACTASTKCRLLSLRKLKM
jgi:hypothetical protein